MYRHVQTVFTVLALDLVGILTFLQKSSRSLNAAARDSATQRGVAAMMIGAAGAVEFSAVLRQQFERVKLSVASGVVERVVVGASSPCFEEHLEDFQVVTVDSLVDAAGQVGSVIEQDLCNLCQCLPLLLAISSHT